MPFRMLATILALSTAALAVAWPDSPRVPPDRPGSPRSDSVAVPVSGPGDSPDWLAAVALSQEHFYAEAQAQIDAYLAAFEAERLAREAAANAAQTARSRAPVAATMGECTGFAIPDYIIQRESGGNPSAYNPSGAYGCAQTLLSHYSSGACRGLDPYTIDGQRQCVWILSSGGTNLQPWSTR